MERFFNRHFHKEITWTAEKQEGFRYRTAHFPGLARELPQLMGKLGEVEIESQAGDSVTLNIDLKEPLKVVHDRPAGNKGPVVVKQMDENIITTPGLGVKVMSPVENEKTNIRLEINLRTPISEGESINMRIARWYVNYLTETLKNPWIVSPLSQGKTITPAERT